MFVERAVFVDTFSFEFGCLQWNSDAVSFRAGVDVCVLAIVADEVVVAEELDADDDVAGGGHDNEVGTEMEVDGLVVMCEGGDVEG